MIDWAASAEAAGAQVRRRREAIDALCLVDGELERWAALEANPSRLSEGWPPPTLPKLVLDHMRRALILRLSKPWGRQIGSSRWGTREGRG